MDSPCDQTCKYTRSVVRQSAVLMRVQIVQARYLLGTGEDPSELRSDYHGSPHPGAPSRTVY